jgi:hypothetical protein
LNCVRLSAASASVRERALRRLGDQLVFSIASLATSAHIKLMMQTIEAVIDQNGVVRLLEPIRLSASKRALVTILEEGPEANNAALLSEAALGEDWNRPEEEAAWAHLQPDTSS